jgi:hypothetical protein
MLYVGLASSALLLLAVALFSDDVDAQTGGARHGGKDEPLPRWMLVLSALLLVPQLWEIGRSGAFLNRVALFGSETAARTVTSLVLSAGALALVAWLAKRARDPLLHLAAILFALSALAKGPVGIALCAAPLLVTIAFLGEWWRLLRPAAASCTVLFLAIAGPWFAVMGAFTGLDDQRKTWFSRFVLYDLLGRVGEGAHGDRGTFDYYLRYAGFGLFPWSALVPIALIDAALKPFRSRAGRFLLLVALWAVITFVFFSVTTTKFHHYIFPICVPAALLVGRFLDELMDAGAPRIAPVAAVIIVLLTALIGRDLVTEPWQLIDLFTYHYKSYKPEYYFPSDNEWRIGLSIACFGAAATIGIGLGLDIASPRGDGPAQSWLERITLGNRGANSNFVAAALVAGILFAVFAVQVHFNRASQHWSQRNLLNTYYEMRKGDEPLIAYQMDWKGETFYGRNNDVQVKKSGADLKKLVERAGREFVLVQADRFGGMKSALGKDYEAKITVVNRSNVKWYLVLVDE